MQGFLATLAGARPEILDRCPTERIKFQSLGWTILITSGMATVSMWFALNSALGINPFLAFPIAVCWGLIIMGIDRWLITSIPISGSRRLALAAPRVLLAILLGTIISTPLVLRIFQSEINAQISVIKEARANDYLKSLAHSSITRQVTVAQAKVASLQKTIDSNGTVTPDPSKDPIVISLTSQRTSELALEQKYYKQWQCQLYGGPDCPAKGNGVLAQASEARYRNAVGQVATLTGEIRKRIKTITATDAASDGRRLAQAREALPAAKQQLSVAQARLNALRNSFDQTNQSANGLLLRLQALSELTASNFTLAAARFFVFLLFLTIECLPVTVKLLQRPGNYERILQVAQEREFKEARRSLSAKPRGFSGQAPTFDQASNGNIEKIWTQQQTKAYDRPGRSGAAPPPDVDEAEENTHLDEIALKDMADQRNGANGNSAFQSGGIDLRWQDGER